MVRANGQHISSSRLNGFFDILASLFTLESIHFTGGGESLFHKDVPALVRRASEITSVLSMSTSGAGTRAMGRRLSEIASLLQDLYLSHNPEDQRSFTRMRRTLLGELPVKTTIRARISPEYEIDFNRQIGRQLLKVITETGFQGELSEHPLLNVLAALSTGLHFKDARDRHLHLTPESVVAEGRARTRLKEYSFPAPAGYQCPYLAPLEDGRGTLHIYPNHTISHCCALRAKGLEEMTEEGLFRLLDRREEDRQLLADTYTANAGKPIHHICDLCPFIN